MNKFFSLIFCLILIINIPAAASDIPPAGDFAVPLIQAEAAVVIDGETGQVLYNKNMHRRMYPASVTKIMTALLALEHGELTDTITMSRDAVYTVGRHTSHIDLAVGEIITLEQALYALAINSGNDASNGVAELIGGSMSGFAAMMNDRAREAGARDTHFSNSHGLPESSHYTTPYDMARIMMAASKNPIFVRIFSAESYIMPPTNMRPERIFERTGSLITGAHRYDGVIAEKTGWTTPSGHTFAVTARLDGRTAVVVTMNAPDRVARREDTAILLDYVFGETRRVNISAEELSIKNYPFKENGEDRKADFLAADFSFFLDRNISEDDVNIEYISFYDESGRLQIKAVFTLKSLAHANIYPGIGEMILDRIDIETPDISPFGAAGIITSGRGSNHLLSAFLWIAGVLLAAFMILRVRRNIIISRRRKKRRLEQRRRRSLPTSSYSYGNMNTRQSRESGRQRNVYQYPQSHGNDRYR